MYNVADILVSSQSFPHELLASESGIWFNDSPVQKTIQSS